MQPVATEFAQSLDSVGVECRTPEECALDAGRGSLLTTRLAAPPPGHALIARPALLERLTSAVTRPLTLISAAAGYGKTTLLSDWLRRQRRPVAWVSLDAGDNLPTQFWRYIIGALQAACLTVGGELLALLHAPHPRPTDVVLVALLNTLATAAHDIVLALDNYQVIRDPAIHEAVAFFVQHAPPQLHLVIASRTDPPLPLAHLRARGALAELRAADLALTQDETAALLRQAVPRALARDDIAAVVARTEGWPAGVQLLALALRESADPQRLIARLSGSHPYILDYLTDEVLRRQPEPIQRFLLRTAILDRLSGPLCDAVAEPGTGDLGSAEAASSRLILEYLSRANVFTMPLDDERRWYRYHPLFAEALRAVLRQAEPERLARLHRRAAQWYLQEGYIPEAIQHTLAAGDREHAAHLIERAAPSMLLRGEHQLLLGWLGALPAGLLAVWPNLLLARAWALLQSGQLDESEAALADVEERLRQPCGDGAIQSAALTEVRAIGACAAARRSAGVPALLLVQAALAQLPPEHGLARSELLLSLGWCNRADNDLAAAGAAFAEAATVSLASANGRAAIFAMARLAEVYAAQGDLHRAAERYQRTLQLIATRGWEHLPAAGAIHVGIGSLLYEWNELDAATQHLISGIALANSGAELEIVVSGSLALAQIQMARGELDQAQAIVQNVSRRMPGGATAALRARIDLAQGNIVAAARWARTSALEDSSAPPYACEVEYLARARVLIAQGAADRALAFLECMQTTAMGSGRGRSLIERHVLQALAYEALGEMAQALAVLKQALAIAEGQGYIRSIIDAGPAIVPLLVRLDRAERRRRSRQEGRQFYAHSLLLALHQHDAGAPARSAAATAQRAGAPLIEPLTERERDVLRLLAAGRSNREIAQQLVIALSTVKAHVHNIYGKLVVRSRTRAVAAARELCLLEP